MIDIKQAVAASQRFAADTLGTNDLLLEEIKSVDNFFLITLSFPNRQPSLGTRPAAWNPARYRDREYKVFSVDKQSGDVVQMSIRDLSGVL